MPPTPGPPVSQHTTSADCSPTPPDGPGRRVRFDPRWATQTVLALARGIEAEAAFDRLPVLADALEEAGCDSPALLAHCRHCPAHAPGCWAVGLVLSHTPVDPRSAAFSLPVYPSTHADSPNGGPAAGEMSPGGTWQSVIGVGLACALAGVVIPICFRLSGPDSTPTTRPLTSTTTRW